MNSAKTVSVITPSFNDGNNLYKCYESIKVQNFDSLEWIIVDDGSTDNTHEVVEEIQAMNFPCLSIVYNKISNSGACKARNIGFSLSSGKYIKFLDADDILEENHINFLLNVITTKELDIAIGKTISRFCYHHKYIDVSITKKLSVYNCVDPRIIMCLYVNGKLPSFHHSSLLIRRQKIDEIGGWQEHLLADQDGDFLLRLFMTSPAFEFIDSPSFIYIRNLNSTNRITTNSPDKSLSRYKSAQKFRICYRQLLKKELEIEENLAEIVNLSISNKYFSVARWSANTSFLIFRKCIFRKVIIDRSSHYKRLLIFLLSNRYYQLFLLLSEFVKKLKLRIKVKLLGTSIT